MHTPLCGHARGEPIEYVREAAAKGIGLVTFTCHIPMDWEAFGGAKIRMDREDLDRYFALIGQTAKQSEELGVRVLVGIEAEIFPDESHLVRMDEILAARHFDFVLGSLHPQLRSYRIWQAENGVSSPREVIETYFKQLADGARSGRYDSIAHPDVVRHYGSVPSFDPGEYEEPIREFLGAALDSGTCIEVNTSGRRREPAIIHPDPLILEWAAGSGLGLTIGSDAHSPSSVGQFFEPAFALLKEKGFDQLHWFEGRSRQTLPLPEAVG